MGGHYRQVRGNCTAELLSTAASCKAGTASLCVIFLLHVAARREPGFQTAPPLRHDPRLIISPQKRITQRKPSPVPLQSTGFEALRRSVNIAPAGSLCVEHLRKWSILANDATTWKPGPKEVWYPGSSRKLLPSFSLAPYALGRNLTCLAAEVRCLVRSTPS